MNRRLFLVSLVIAGIFIIFGCRRTAYESRFIPENETWNFSSKAVFEVNTGDNSGVFNVDMVLIHKDDYSYRNLWLFSEIKSPSGSIRRDTLELYLADDYGNWFGIPNGNHIVNQFWYRKNIRFPEEGVYEFSFEQAMRDADLNGISEIGLKVLNAE